MNYGKTTKEWSNHYEGMINPLCKKENLLSKKKTSLESRKKNFK